MRWRFWTRGAGAATLVAVETPEYWTVSEAAAQCGVTRRTFYKWAREGEIEPAAYYRNSAGLAPLFDPGAVIALARSRKTVREPSGN